ncbi:hypothetical protein [Bifidobacterium jacchi]|uniref:FtsK domain-containing protein n=1 Tax=Bifidobacterium jacchi TaxID=2490545 RepID=A0A5N5RC78_9BIFI|nr:hypothetical protein [Bifidobacterium jacchi]KAB5603493.1 hypothetical protein EHS19_10360 [Bifidobacterium jacchi]
MGLLDTLFGNGMVGSIPRPSYSTNRSGEYIKQATESDILAAWPAAIRTYRLQTVAGNPHLPLINTELVPKTSAADVNRFAAIRNGRIHGNRIYGKPGSGLSESGFNDRQIKSGAEGERIFASLLSRDGVLDRCVSFWSLSRPTKEGLRDESGADLDCVLLIGNRALFIDVKKYRAGLVYHTLIPEKAMFCTYPNTGMVANAPYIFSVNMNWARSNLAEYLRPRCPGLTMDFYVVLVPGEAGEAKLDDDIRWPGGIPALSYDDFIRMVREMLPETDHPIPRTGVEGFFASMVKHYGTCPIIDASAPVNANLWPKPTFNAESGVDELNPVRKNRKASSVYDLENPGAKHRERKDPEREPSPRYRESHHSGANTGSNRDTGNYRNGGNPHSAKRQNGKRRPTVSITTVPELDPSTLSFECGFAPDSSNITLSFANVSGVVAAGTTGSGEITHMLFCMVLLSKQVNAQVHMIDCRDSSYLDSYSPLMYSLVHKSEGLDMLLGEIQSVNTAVNMRLRTIKQLKPDGGYWSIPPDKRPEPIILFINECNALFDPDLEDDVTDEDLRTINTIQRYIRQIIERGEQAGAIVILSTQHPGSQALPRDLTDLCKLRICFGKVSPAASQAIFRNRFQGHNPTNSLDKGHAVISTEQGSHPDVRFYSASKQLMDELLGNE